MVLNWFFKDEFEQFYSRVERLQKFLRIVGKELLLDHFVELRRHFRQIKKILPKLNRLYQEELRTVARIPESDYKEKLKKFSVDLEKELSDLENWVNNALALVEEILKIRVLTQVQEQKQKLETIINHITNLLIKAQRDAFELVKLEKAWKKSIKKAHKKPIAKISVVGKLNNGWCLSDIQSVIIDLGGVVKPNPDGKHPYKIVFPGHRSIPLAESTPPFMLIREVSSATGTDNKILIASFYQGELVAA